MTGYLNIVAEKLKGPEPHDHAGREDEPSSWLHLAVLISNKGTGSNLQAIIDAIKGGDLPNTAINLVVSDRTGAQGLQRATSYTISAEVRQLTDRKNSQARDEYSRELAELLNRNGIHVAVMAGFGTILTSPFSDNFQGVSVNVHPGAIPEAVDQPFTIEGVSMAWNKGMMTEKAVVNFLPLPFVVSTVHIVTNEPDFGPVLERGIERVLTGDTVESLYARLKIQEHQALIRALKDSQRIFALAGKQDPRTPAILGVN